MPATLLFALVLHAPGLPDGPLPRPPRPGDRVTLAEFDRAGEPAAVMVAIDRATFEACDADGRAYLRHWEDGEVWHVESPVRAVLVELPPPNPDDSDVRRPVVLVRLLEGPYEGLTLAAPQEVVTWP